MERKFFVPIYKTLVVFFVLGFSLLVGGRLGYTEEVRGVTRDEIKISAIGDQTGPAASVGIPIVEATKLYFRNINDQGGIHLYPLI